MRVMTPGSPRHRIRLRGGLGRWSNDRVRLSPAHVLDWHNGSGIGNQGSPNRFFGIGKAFRGNSVTQAFMGSLGLSASLPTSLGMANKGSVSFPFADGKNRRRHAGQRPWVTGRFPGRSTSSISWLHQAQTRFIAPLLSDGLQEASFIPTAISGPMAIYPAHGRPGKMLQESESARCGVEPCTERSDRLHRRYHCQSCACMSLSTERKLSLASAADLLLLGVFALVGLVGCRGMSPGDCLSTPGLVVWAGVV